MSFDAAFAGTGSLASSSIATALNAYGGVDLLADSPYFTQATSSESITTWTPKTSSIGGNFTQATSNKKPIHDISSLSGRSVARFDPTNTQDLVTSLPKSSWGFMHHAAGCTFFAVCSCTGGSGVQVVFDNHTENSTLPGVHFQFNKSSSVATFLVANNGGTVAVSTVSAAATINQLAIYEGFWSYPGNVSLRVNGGTPVAGAVSVVPDTGDPNANLTIGSNTIGTIQGLSGDIARILIVPGVLSTTELNAIRQELGTLYNITVS